MQKTYKQIAQLLLVIAIAIPIYNYNNCCADMIALPIEELLKDQKQNKDFKEKHREPKPTLNKEFDINKNIDKKEIFKEATEKQE